MFISILDSVANFGCAVVENESMLSSMQKRNASYLQLLVHNAYCYAFVQLHKGVAAADEAIDLATAAEDMLMLGHAHCAKAWNLFRIGHVVQAQDEAMKAIGFFQKANSPNDLNDGYLIRAMIINLSVQVRDTPTYLATALQGYTLADNATGISMCRIQECMLRFLEGEQDKAIHALEEIIEELNRQGKKHLLCFAYMHQCNIRFLRQDVPLWKRDMEIWLEIAAATGNGHDCAMATSLLVECARIQKLDKTVMENCLKAAELCDKLGSLHGAATIAIITGNICFEQEQYAEALAYYELARNKSVEMKDIYKSMYSLNAIGLTLAKAGNLNASRETFEKALLEGEAMKDIMNTANSYRYLTDLLLEQGNYDAAFACFNKLCHMIGENSLQVQDYGRYPVLLAKAGDDTLRAAGIDPGNRKMLRINALKKYLLLAPQRGKREEANACKALADFYEEQGESTAALTYYKQYSGLYEQIMNEENISAITRLRLEHEAEAKEKEIALLRKENEEALLNERLRISQDLHDDMGATLSSISIYSEAVKQRYQNQQIAEAENLLNIISDDAREMVSKIGDMVWMINPKNDTMERLLERMQNYAVELLAACGIQTGFEYDDSIHYLTWSIAGRKNFFLLFKEAINNAAKYSGGTEVHVNVTMSGDKLRMAIRDNGKGFDPDIEYSGNGLNNMRQRASALSGMLQIVSGTGGTAIHFDCLAPHK